MRTNFDANLGRLSRQIEQSSSYWLSMATQAKKGMIQKLLSHNLIKDFLNAKKAVKKVISHTYKTRESFRTLTLRHLAPHEHT